VTNSDTNLPNTSGALVTTTRNVTSIKTSDPSANQAAAAPGKKFRPAATRNGG
ncbi:hypothetical protein M405DRAFT_820257, partial [Rhizopogon salebrosus TDB-379]